MMLKTPSTLYPKMQKFKRVLEILKENKYDKTKLVRILQQVQDEYRYLPKEILSYISTVIDVPTAEVFGVATFYTHFSITPKGEYVLKVCNGTACHVKGAMDLYLKLREKLELEDDIDTTTDMKFTLETVSCIGACSLAPAIVVGEDVRGHIQLEEIEPMLEELINKK